MDLLKDVLLALNRPRVVVKMVSVSLEMWHGGGWGGAERKAGLQSLRPEPL